MRIRELTVTITASSHPDFDLFATTTINGRQVSRRGDRAEIDLFILQIATHGINVTVIDDTTPCGCPVRPAPEIRGDSADTLVDHGPGCTALDD